MSASALRDSGRSSLSLSSAASRPKGLTDGTTGAADRSGEGERRLRAMRVLTRLVTSVCSLDTQANKAARKRTEGEAEQQQSESHTFSSSSIKSNRM